jgi:hypothetical protein
MFLRRFVSGFSISTPSRAFAWARDYMTSRSNGALRLDLLTQTNRKHRAALV